MCGGAAGRGGRKPLVIFTPKSLLRHPRAVSTVHDLTAGGFQEVLADETADRAAVSRVVFCSGKVYYDLLAGRDERKAGHVALVRVEQLYPFDGPRVAEILAQYAPTAGVVWRTEEPRNMGPWRFLEERID